jgi:hypothetical protein
LYSSEALASQSNLRSIFQAKKFLNHIIRNEHLETDLILSLENGGIELTEEQRTWICAGKTHKTNTSARQGVEYYYDQDSIELVKDRESLIIEMHDYKPPQI